MLATETNPFVLLDDARANGAPARLYRAPARIVSTRLIAEVAPLLEEVRRAAAAGQHAAGFLAYEAATAFEPVLGDMPVADGSLMWFGLFDGYEEIAPGDVPALLPDPAGAWIGAPRPLLDRARYDAQIAEVLDLIRAGDIYQANLTYRALVPFAGHPLAAYAQLRARSLAGFGAIVATGDETLLSLSPELFFAIEEGQLQCRPMKGTARRGVGSGDDGAMAARLRDDPKQRAENLMIVDLMRNDLSRIAVAGSVAVPALFEVETYPTVHQMVSTVTATLAPGKDAIDAIAALFPCGSITGAPKIRAMQAIAAIEDSARGAYTGAIGRIDPHGDAMFNVAIRTLTIGREATSALIGVGGGIVADSVAAEEWDEAQAKADFLTRGRREVDLIETMRFDPDHGVALLDRHLARMKASADLFGFAFDRHAARNELQAATFRLRAPSRVRLLLAKSGAIAIATAPLPAPPAGRVPVAVVPLPVDRHDFRLRHKTTDRGFYDQARAAAGTFEIAFVDADGFLTEGSFTSLFVPRGDVLVTPPLARGLLPGVLRADLLASGKAIEDELVPGDLTGGFFIGNALRGLLPATVAPQHSGSL